MNADEHRCREKRLFQSTQMPDEEVGFHAETRLRFIIPFMGAPCAFHPRNHRGMDSRMSHPPTRILNAETLTNHGHIEGRKLMLEILEAGLRAANPYYAVRRLMRRGGRYAHLRRAAVCAGGQPALRPGGGGLADHGAYLRLRRGQGHPVRGQGDRGYPGRPADRRLRDRQARPRGDPGADRGRARRASGAGRRLRTRL